MPLAHNQALELYQRILVPIPEWGVLLSDDSNTEDTEDSEDHVEPFTPELYTDERLIAARQQTLSRFSRVIQHHGQPVRIFENEASFSPQNRTAEFYGRGLDTARAVLCILQYANANQQVVQPLITNFDQQMQQYIQNKDIAKARAELRRFNGVMARLLATTLTEDRASRFRFRHAVQAINFVRDFLWKRDICTPSCVVQAIGDDKVMLRHASPLRFQPIQTQRDVWGPDQGWRRKLSRSVDGRDRNGGSRWLEAFMADNLETMKTLSSTPMSRFTPNPANAFDCTDVIIDTAQNTPRVVGSGYHRRMAVTEPLQANQTSSRHLVTLWNHHLLVRDQQLLKSALDSWFEQWGDLVQQADRVPFPLLHQTLIGDEVTFAPDQGKARSSRLQSSVINSKSQANAHLRQWLVGQIVLRDKTTGEISYSPAQQNHDVPDTHQRIDIELLETNNCINMWNTRARVRNRDVNDGRRLIALAASRFQSAREKLDENGQASLQTILDFLRSPDHALISPFKYRGPAVKTALAALSATLRAPEKQEPGFSGHNFALSLAAAVELKCMVHETWAVSLRRVIGNFTRDYFRMLPVFGHIADWAVRGSMAAAAFVLRYTVNLVNIRQTIRHYAYRREIAKAAYEGLLAESLGLLQGGCMSSVDRAGEMAEQRAAMRTQFAVTGTLVSYNDTPAAKKAFYRTYSRSDAKRVFALMATGTEGTSDNETRGILGRAGVVSTQQSKAERKVIKSLKSMRKGEYRRKETPASYLGLQGFFPPGKEGKHEDQHPLLSQTL